MKNPTSHRAQPVAAHNVWAGLDTRAGYFLTRLNPDGQTKRIVARFDNESTIEEQAELFRACNSHAGLVEALEQAADALHAIAGDPCESSKVARLSHEANKAARAALQSAKEGQPPLADLNRSLNNEIAKRDSAAPFSP